MNIEQLERREVFLFSGHPLHLQKETALVLRRKTQGQAVQLLPPCLRELFARLLRLLLLPDFSLSFTRRQRVETPHSQVLAGVEVANVLG